MILLAQCVFFIVQHTQIRDTYLPPLFLWILIEYCLSTGSFETYILLTMVSEREDISIAEVVVYIPLALVALYVSFRHGFIKSLGWIYLVIFCTLRTAGGIFGILSAKHPTNRNDATWSAILGSIGLSPLLLCSLGLLARV